MSLNKFYSNEEEREERMMENAIDKYDINLIKSDTINNENINKLNIKKKNENCNIKTIITDDKIVDDNIVNGFSCSEIDFLEFSKFIDSLWCIKSNKSSIINLNPPKRFVKNLSNSYIKKLNEIMNLDIKNFILYQESNEGHIQNYNSKSNNNPLNSDKKQNKSDFDVTKLNNYDDLMNYNNKKHDFLIQEYLKIKNKRNDDNDDLSLIEDEKSKNINNNDFLLYLEKIFWNLINLLKVDNNKTTDLSNSNSIENSDEKQLYCKHFTQNIFIKNVDLSKIFCKSEINTYIFPFLIPNFFSLMNICYLPDSLLQYIYKESEDIIKPGFNIPLFHQSTIFSSSNWNVENCYKIYYLHEGAEIIWYSINVRDSKKVEKELTKQSDIDLETIKKMGIKINKTIQRQGQMIICIPGSFYRFVCLGLSKFESINYIVSIINSIRHQSV